MALTDEKKKNTEKTKRFPTLHDALKTPSHLTRISSNIKLNPTPPKIFLSSFSQKVIPTSYTKYEGKLRKTHYLVPK